MSAKYVGRIRRSGVKAWRSVEGQCLSPEAALANAVRQMLPDDVEAAACVEEHNGIPAHVVMTAKRKERS